MSTEFIHVTEKHTSTDCVRVQWPINIYTAWRQRHRVPRIRSKISEGNGIVTDLCPVA